MSGGWRPDGWADLAAYCSAAARFAADHSVLHAVHADDFFVASAWDRMPAALQEELSLADAVAVAAPQRDPPDVSVGVREFARLASKLTLSRVPGQGPSPLPGCERGLPKRLTRGLSGKKEHEVVRMGALTADVCTSQQARTVINLGEGKGYLSAVLADVCGLDTVGIDCVERNTESSRQRAAAVEQHAGRRETAAPEAGCGRMRAVTHRVELGMSEAEWRSVLGPATDPRSACVIGLHACGDLGSCAVQLFAESGAAALCLAPCCHHALTEAGFPLSRTVREVLPGLNTVSRMLACAAADRWGDEAAEAQRRPLLLHYYRAALCGILNGPPVCAASRVSLPPALLRKLAKQTDLTFVQYATAALSHLARSAGDSAPEWLARLEQVDPDVLRRWEADCDTGAAAFARFAAWLCLRRRAAGVLEGLLVTDRVMYLHERGLRNSRAVPLFDPAVSPRSFVILAVRD
eukprot:TRINITY_DN17324_c0_g1_i1.p2 TRINITY_DN17324_c0_g1~~TRINITY_DN17324_c0_g1_i1.p2  ORF type:complete len:483 (+),score=123.99 TRINITY_DN17324_c0_g1_i1:58-1449(+)